MVNQQQKKNKVVQDNKKTLHASSENKQWQQSNIDKADKAFLYIRAGERR